jgi:hypothetical protein
MLSTHLGTFIQWRAAPMQIFENCQGCLDLQHVWYVQVGNKSFGLEALMKHLGRSPSEVCTASLLNMIPANH